MKRWVLLLAVLLQSGMHGCTQETVVSDRGGGEFYFVSNEECLYSSAFGPPPVLQALGPTVVESTTTQGVLKLDGTGAGTVQGKSSTVASLPAGGVVQQALLRCSVTYQRGERGEFSMEQRCDATPLRGARSTAALTFTVSPMRVRGYWKDSTILAADTELGIETVTSFNGANAPRLCHRTWSAERIRTDR